MNTTRNLLVAAALSTTAVFSFAQAPQALTTPKAAIAATTAKAKATPATAKNPAVRHAATSHHVKHQARHHKAVATQVHASPVRAATASPAIK